MPNKQTKIFPLVISIILVNAAGFLLRYFELDTFIIILGFRFHLSAVLPFLIIFRVDQLTFIKQLLVRPESKEYSKFIWISVLPIIIIIGVALIFGLAKIGDPDFFYELGISSIADLPLYLIWNIPQFFLLIFYLLIASSVTKQKILSIILFAVLIFVYEFIPFRKEVFNPLSLIAPFLFAVASALLLVRFSNIYWNAIVLIATIWSGILAFGTNSLILTKLFLGRNYSEWDGFFILLKFKFNYLLPIQFLFMILLLIVLRKRSN